MNKIIILILIAISLIFGFENTIIKEQVNVLKEDLTIQEGLYKSSISAIEEMQIKYDVCKHEKYLPRPLSQVQ